MSEQDYTDLLNAAVDHAADLLAAHTEFAPFALATQAEDGEVFHIGPEEEDGDESDGAESVAALRAELHEQASRWRAVAVVADVTLEDDDGELVTAAIHVALEHVGGDPVDCIVPYVIEEDGSVALDELVMEPGERVVFSAPVEA